MSSVIVPEAAQYFYTATGPTPLGEALLDALDFSHQSAAQRVGRLLRSSEHEPYRVNIDNQSFVVVTGLAKDRFWNGLVRASTDGENGADTDWLPDAVAFRISHSDVGIGEGSLLLLSLEEEVMQHRKWKALAAVAGISAAATVASIEYLRRRA